MAKKSVTALKTGPYVMPNRAHHKKKFATASTTIVMEKLMKTGIKKANPVARVSEHAKKQVRTFAKTKTSFVRLSQTTLQQKCVTEKTTIVTVKSTTTCAKSAQPSVVKANKPAKTDNGMPATLHNPKPKPVTMQMTIVTDK
tara:strand:- start:14 stop:439 length:426 start_codon:yes stop_codon:yes gene_type:complete